MSKHLCLDEDAFGPWIEEFAAELDVRASELAPGVLGYTRADSLACLINAASEAGVIRAMSPVASPVPGARPAVAAYAVDGEVLVVVRPAVQLIADGGFQLCGYPEDPWRYWPDRPSGVDGIRECLLSIVERADRLSAPLLVACLGSRSASVPGGRTGGELTEEDVANVLHAAADDDLERAELGDR
jgi:hypothetical protein